MYDRTHYVTGHTYIEGEPGRGREDCQILVLCHDPEPEYTTLSHHRTTCPDCLLLLGDELRASISRRLEIDAWLKAEGAIVIRVEDLGAAMEAAYRGQESIRFATRPGGWGPDNVIFAGSEAARAAHLARQALRLAEGS